MEHYEFETTNFGSSFHCCKGKRGRLRALPMFIQSIPSPSSWGYGLHIIFSVRKGQLTVMVYLHWARVFQSLMDLSREPETIWRLSAEKATDRTSLVCDMNWRVDWPLQRYSSLLDRTSRKDFWMTYVLMSQRRRVLSQEPDRANWPSEEMTTSDTKWLWPVSERTGRPMGSPSDEAFAFTSHTRMVLSASHSINHSVIQSDIPREAEMTVVDESLRVNVAICVTQPVCPSKVPISFICSCTIFVLWMEEDPNYWQIFLSETEVQNIEFPKE